MNHKKVYSRLRGGSGSRCLSKRMFCQSCLALSYGCLFFFFFSFCFKNLLTIKFKLVLFPFDEGTFLHLVSSFSVFYLLQPKRKLNQLLFPIPINIQQLLFKTIINKIKLIRLQLKYLNLLLTPLTKG